MKYKHRHLKFNKAYVVAAIALAILLTWTLISSFGQTTESSAWDGIVANSFTSGTGTENNPYVISSPGELAYFKSLLEGDAAAYYVDKNYVITNSFDYGDYDLSINNTVPFAGTIDGRYNFIKNVNLSKSLFVSLDGATIKNLNLKNLNITVNDKIGVIANETNKANIDFLLLDGAINVASEITDSVSVAGLFDDDTSSKIKSTIINFRISELIDYVSILNSGSDTVIENVLVNGGYGIVGRDVELDVTKVYKFSVDNNTISVNSNDLSKFNDESYEVVLTDNVFEFSSIIPVEKNEVNNSKGPTRSAAISLHNSGIDTSNHAIYVNDLTADYNYYIGLNYTEIRNINGTIPDGSNQQLYSNSNLATVYIRYSGADINDSTTYGTVSVSEDIRDYYYYKRYPVVSGYIEFDLIDNPWANRPAGRAFNGWVTDYTNAVVSLDMDTYVRSVKIPVSDINNPISITFYSSWTVASLAETTGEISSNLKSVTMQELAVSYGNLSVYHYKDHVNNNSYYPSDSPLYNMNGTRVTSGSRCRTNGGCDYVRPNGNAAYSGSREYYRAIANGNNATLTRVYPSKQSSVSYYNSTDDAAGLFIRVTSGTQDIYSSNGTKLTTCGSSCYKLLQYGEQNVGTTATYYYLPTRDTNIFAPSSTSTITTGNISTSLPMTITGINGGVDNSSNRTIQLSADWTIGNDIRIEFITFYVSSTTTSVTTFNSGTNYYKIIGNFKNVKLGRGLKRSGSNLTATSFVGGNNSSTSSLTKYTLIVESGFYQNGSATGYSTYNHYVQGDIILGSDYDRIASNNNNLIVYYCYAGSWGSTLASTNSTTNTYDVPAVYTTIKSGSFGTNKGDYAAGVYVGGRAGGTHYALRAVMVEGGYIYNLIGGPASASARASKNDIIINVKGGEIDLVFGGAGATDTVGNKIVNVTGGTINYSILGGSNANEYSSNTTNPYGKIDGDTLLYVGGNVIVGTKSDKLFTIPSGDVYGAGNGRSGEWDVGAVNNSNVIIGPTATINGNVYGGGNNGAVGGNTVGNVSFGGSGSGVTTSGVYEDGTTDNSIRYYGADPDNYIQFNGDVYRIIGLFNNVSTTSGSKDLVRIVKNTSVTTRVWGDSNMSTVETNTSTETSSSGWGTNTYNYTNYYKNYYNFYVKNNNSTSNMYNYLNTTYYNGLNSTYRNYIEEVNWGLGATGSINQNASTFYTAERGSGVVNYLTGINQSSNGSSAYTSAFKIGLFYPSDYGFANNTATCLSSNLGSYSSSCRTNNWMSGMTNAWTMTPSTDVTSVTRSYQVSRTGNWFNYTYTMNRYYHVVNRNFVTGNSGIELKDIYYTSNDNDANNYYNTGAVYPSFYLKDDVRITSGTGTSADPYIIGSTGDKLTDIIDEIMHPTETPPDPEPVVVTFNESNYQNRTHINIIGGTINGSVYGAGNSNGAGNNTKSSNGEVALSKITIDMTGGTVSHSIYGGANALGTVYGDVFINVENGTIGESVYGGGQGGYDNSGNGTYVACNVNVNIGSANTTSLTIQDSVYGGSAFGSVNVMDQNATTTSFATRVTVTDGVIVGSVFGGGEGDNSHTPRVVGPITVTIDGGDITNVFGGNDQAGTHTNLNRIYLNNGIIDNVYGGGNRSSITNTHVYLQGASVTNLYGGSNTLGDVSTTTVEIKSGTVVTAYGGNKSGGTCGSTSVVVDGTATISSALYGGGMQVATANTSIELKTVGNTIPNVYGGGHNAGVTSATITKRGTTVTSLFGGSNVNGTVGSTLISHIGGTTTNLYGGNNAGGNTVASTVNFTGGTVTQNLYGGGSHATTGTSTVSVSGGAVNGSVFGGGDNAGLTTSTVTVTGGAVGAVYGGSNSSGTVTNPHVTINASTGSIGSVYGGGNRASVGTTSVIITNGTIDYVFGGGNLAQVTGNTVLDINGGTINHDIYGGGDSAIVTGSSTVTITNATILGSAYAGGNGSAAVLQGSTSITIDGNTTIGTTNSVPPATGSVFGGGKQAATGLEANNNSTSAVNIVSGTIYGNVYGGANTSVIYGNTVVNIGQNAVNNNNLTSGNIYVKGHVFGGGEANASGSETYDWYYISVTQGTVITVDGSGHNSFAIDGSFYGGGNASSASGTSYLYVKNYGTISAPKFNVSIQRVDYVTIDNSAFVLKGAIDRANDYDRELFSISRVLNLKLKNNSTLFLETGANLLESFESLDSSGNKAAVTINGNTVTKTVDNRIYMFEGRNLNIAKDQQVTDYGTVSGMTFFGIFNYDNNRQVNIGMYSPNYDPGDVLDLSGTFTRGSYVLGKHVANHDIEVDGFYSHFMQEETAINEVKYIVPTPSGAQYYMWFIGENVVEYNINLVASKYSTLGSVEYSFMDFYKPNTSFQILTFDSSEMTSGVTLVDKNNIPRIASTSQIANNQFGLAMEASNTGWLTTGKTSFYTTEPSMSGVTYYEGENSSVVPTMLFYLYHSKNITEEKDLGTARISIMSITKLNALSNEVKRLVVNVNMSTALFQTAEYEGAMTPGDKYELFTSTSNNITTKSKFSAYYALYAENENVYRTGYHRVLASSYVLPENTKITMLDFVNGVPEYYYHIITSADVQAAQTEYNLQGECSYALSMFTKMGSRANNSNYNDAAMNAIYYDGNDSSEEFIFIVDFADTNITQDRLGNTLLIEIRGPQEESIVTVLGIQHSQLTYNLYNNCDSIIDISATESLDPLYIGYSDIFDVSVSYQNSSISGVMVTDTQYFDSKLGLQVYIKNSEDHIVSGTDLTGTYFSIDGLQYYPDIDGVTHIKMSDKVGNAQKWLIFNTDNSSLATGDYTFVFEAFGSADGMYYSDSLPDEEEVDITIINTTYGFNPVLNANSVIFSKDNNKDLMFTVNYTSLLENPNIRLAVFRREYDSIYDTDYELIDFSDLAESELNATSNLHEYLIINEPFAVTGCTIQLNDELVTGTYRLSFRLYDGDTMIGEVVRYIIIR